MRDGGRDREHAALQKDAELGEEVAARDAVASERVLGGVGAGGDGDRDEPGAEIELPEDLDDGGADAGGVDGEGFVRVDGVAREDLEVAGEDFGGVMDEVVDAMDDLEVGQAEGEAFGMAEDEAEAREFLPGDGIAALEGNDGALEDDEGGVVLAAA
jgi:hypothetical protein